MAPARPPAVPIASLSFRPNCIPAISTELRPCHFDRREKSLFRRHNSRFLPTVEMTAADNMPPPLHSRRTDAFPVPHRTHPRHLRQKLSILVTLRLAPHYS